MEGISLGYPRHSVVLSLPKHGGQPVLSPLLGEGWTVLFPGQIPSFMACFIWIFYFFS